MNVPDLVTLISFAEKFTENVMSSGRKSMLNSLISGLAPGKSRVPGTNKMKSGFTGQSIKSVNH